MVDAHRTFGNENLTAQRQAYLYLQDQIVSGRLPDGTRIKPEVVAQILGISRMPVREAIRQLDAEGYLTIRPNRGAIVRARSPADVIEIYEMRAVLEGLAAGIAATVATADDLDEIELQIHRLDRVRDDPLHWIERHDLLHDAFCGLSGREQLRAECRRLRLALTPYVRLFVSRNRQPETPGHEHAVILETLRSRDAAKAETIMRAHVLANAEGVAACLRAPERPANGKPPEIAEADDEPEPARWRDAASG